MAFEFSLAHISVSEENESVFVYNNGQTVDHSCPLGVCGEAFCRKAQISDGSCVTAEVIKAYCTLKLGASGKGIDVAYIIGTVSEVSGQVKLSDLVEYDRQCHTE